VWRNDKNVGRYGEKNCKPGEEYGDEDNNVNGNKNGEC
jgi:hypothetical protein